MHHLVQLHALLQLQFIFELVGYFMVFKILTFVTKVQGTSMLVELLQGCLEIGLKRRETDVETKAWWECGR